MAVLSMGGEARSTPSSYHTMNSPRYGGCVGAFLHFFDWNPGKRFYSTKRLAASKVEDGLRRSRSMRSEDHGSTARARMICDAQEAVEVKESTSAAVPGLILSDDAGAASSRAPSVVARLMGLESLPKGPYQPSARHGRSQSYSGAGELPFSFMTVMDQKPVQPPVLLQDLLQRDLKGGKKTLRDRIPGFAKRAQEQYESRFSKKGAALKVLRCRPDDECMSPYVDIPDVAPKQPFLLRLGPAASQPEERDGPEIASGWPLAAKSRESSFRSERSSLLESEPSSSRPASSKSASSKPALANVARKIFQGRRRASVWNGASEDSESNSSPPVEVADGPLIPVRAPRKPRVASRELASKKATKSLSPPPSRHRATRMKAHNEASVRETKASGAIRPAQSTTATRMKAITSSDDIDAPLIQSRSRSTDFDALPIHSRSRSIDLAQEIIPQPTTSKPGATRPAATKPTKSVTPSRISKPETPDPAPTKLAAKAPPLDGYRTPRKPVNKANKSAVPSSKQTTKNTLQGIQRVRETMLAKDRLNRDETSAELDQASNTDEHTITLGNRKHPTKHARARSIDDVFPVLPPDHTTAATEPDGLKSSAIELLMTEEVFHVDLQEFLAAGPDDLNWEEDDCVEQRVDSPSLFCELRSCSGPSISSVSVDDDDRNGDAWSSCASYNPADCDSPRTFELPAASDTDGDEADLHEPKAVPMFTKSKLLEEQVTVLDEAASQPSPVSILNSPFHDEATESCTLNSDEDPRFKSDSCETISCSLTVKSYDSDNDQIRQALLDISMFQSFTFDYNKEHTDDPRDSERGFVREVLSAANLMSDGSAPIWFDQDVAIDPGLFDRLESGDIEDAGVEKMIQTRSGGLWRCDRKLLFDCVNEAFALTLWQSWCSEMGIQWYSNSRPRGQKLVEEVYRKIEDWRKLTSLSIDFLIERDMGVRYGDWRGFSAEVAEVGMDIESMLWKAIVEEVVMDMVITSKRHFR